MNTAPVTHDDYILLEQAFREKRPAADLEKLSELSSSAGYTGGDPETIAEYYRSYFRMTVKQPQQLDSLIDSLRLSFTRGSILKGRAIGNRLRDETWLSSTYNLLPKLKLLRIPTLVLHGDYDFIPIECAAHIAQAIPGARLVVLRDTGHFAIIESPDEVRNEIGEFVLGT
jgi:proline iminopeptidase